jgi:hypothetical protein
MLEKHLNRKGAETQRIPKINLLDISPSRESADSRHTLLLLCAFASLR